MSVDLIEFLVWLECVEGRCIAYLPTDGPLDLYRDHRSAEDFKRDFEAWKAREEE